MLLLNHIEIDVSELLYLVEEQKKYWYQCPSKRRSAGAAERDGLENRCGGDPTQGSNPCLSANLPTQPVLRSAKWSNFPVSFEGCSRGAVHCETAEVGQIRSLWPEFSEPVHFGREGEQVQPIENAPSCITPSRAKLAKIPGPG